VGADELTYFFLFFPLFVFLEVAIFSYKKLDNDIKRYAALMEKRIACRDE